MQYSEKIANLVSIVIIISTMMIWHAIPPKEPRPSDKQLQQEQLMMAVLEAIQAMPEQPTQTVTQQPESQSITTSEAQLPSQPELQAEKPIEETTQAPAIKKTHAEQTKQIKKTVVSSKKISQTTEVSPKTEPITSHPVIPIPTIQQSEAQETEIKKPQHSTPDLMAQYRGVILQQLAKNKHYPHISRRLQEEGTSVIRFTVQRSGQVTELQLVNSSGYERLDHAALEIFETLQMQLAPFFAEMPESLLSFQLPIVYELQ